MIVVKKYVTAVICVLLCVVLAACSCSHQWQEADCLSPRTCTECGETEGEALGHNWKEATCTESEICSLCGETRGDALGHIWIEANCTEDQYCSICGETGDSALGHSWREPTCTEAAVCELCEEVRGEPLGHTVETWEVAKEATCTETGTEAGLCTVCGASNEREIPLLDHVVGEWEVTLEPTLDTNGIREKKCIVCGTSIETETFELSEEEQEEYYKSKCQKVSYEALSRTPGDYEGNLVKFSGYVVQVCSEAKSSLYYSTYRVATSGRYNDVVYIKVDNYGSGYRILEDDYVTFYGEFDGLFTYETVRGNSLTIPCVIVEYID